MREVGKRRRATAPQGRSTTGGKRERGVILTAACFILLLIVPFAHADSNDDAVFKKGNQFYEKGMYDEAIKEYSLLLGRGLESGNLYFNLGNSYFKKGELGRAVLNYERARRSIPDDPDLRSNYSFALSRIENAPPPESPGVLEKLFGVFNTFTLNGLTITVSVLYILIIAVLTASVFVQPVRRYRIIVISVLSLVLLSGAFSLNSRVSVLDSEAVVVVKSAEARFEPLDNATTHFTLYEGMKVYVIESKTEWSRVRREDGKVGWVLKESVERV